MSWPYAYTPYIWPMLASAIFMAGLAIYAWKHRTVPGAGPFAFQMLFSALWALFTTLEIAAIAEPTKILGYRLGRMAAPLALTALLVFALEYARPGKQTTHRTVLVLSGLALFILALLATNDLHHLYWTRLWFDGYVRVERGPLSSILLGYVLLLPTLALVIFLRLARRTRGIYRTQALFLFFGNALPLLAFLLEPAGINPVAPLSPVILMLNLTGLLFTLAIYRFGMMNIIPVGRDTAVERMADGLLILDAEDRIVDLNPAARKALALSSRDMMGHLAPEVFDAYPELANLMQDDTAAETEMSVNAASLAKYYQVHAVPLVDPGGVRLGRLISFQDVTKQKRVQAQIVEQQRALAALQERERLARDLHDSIGQVLSYVSAQVGAARKLLENQKPQEADEQLARLGEIAQDAHADVRDFILGLRANPSNEQPFPATLRRYLEGFERNFGIHTKLIAAPDVEGWRLSPDARIQLFRIVQEALTNARKHAAPRCIQVMLATEQMQARVTVQDDGRGFDMPALIDQAGGFGLRFMRERAEGLGARVEVTSRPGAGTLVVVLVPLNGEP